MIIIITQVIIKVQVIKIKLFWAVWLASTVLLLRGGLQAQQLSCGVVTATNSFLAATRNVHITVQVGWHSTSVVFPSPLTFLLLLLSSALTILELTIRIRILKA